MCKINKIWIKKFKTKRMDIYVLYIYIYIYLMIFHYKKTEHGAVFDKNTASKSCWAAFYTNTAPPALKPRFIWLKLRLCIAGLKPRFKKRGYRPIRLNFFFFSIYPKVAFFKSSLKHWTKLRFRKRGLDMNWRCVY